MSTLTPTTRIIELANAISSSTAKIQESLSAKGIAPPSFDEDASYTVPQDISSHYDVVLDATAELHDLLLEPLNLIHRHCGHNNPACMLAITTFKIASMVPVNGTISFGDIAKQTPMTEDMTTRLLRHAMTMRIFREPEPGMVAHTSASKVLINPGANAWLQSGTAEMWPAATKLVEALTKWPGSEEPNETGYALCNDSKTLYEVFGSDAERAGRWGSGMQVFVQRPQFDSTYTTNHYDWELLGEAQVVFFGGGFEHVGLALARQFENLSVVVQTLPQVVDAMPVPEDLKARVQIMAHDLFSPQPVKGADVYFLRWCLHNWSNKHCIRMLRALVPALKDGARVMIQETIMPEPGKAPLWKEKNTRATDINMAAAFNGQERTTAELKSLLKEADGRFCFKKVIEPSGSALGMLEFVWEDKAGG